MQGIEEGKKQAEADAKLAYEKSIEDKKQKEEEQRIKDEQLKIQQQQKNELEEKINIQSEKLGGYVNIKNISGTGLVVYDKDNRRHEIENGETVKIDTETARKLLTTNQFELVII